MRRRNGANGREASSGCLVWDWTGREYERIVRIGGVLGSLAVCVSSIFPGVEEMLGPP